MPPPARGAASSANRASRAPAPGSDLAVVLVELPHEVGERLGQRDAHQGLRQHLAEGRVLDPAAVRLAARVGDDQREHPLHPLAGRLADDGLERGLGGQVDQQAAVDDRRRGLVPSSKSPHVCRTSKSADANRAGLERARERRARATGAGHPAAAPEGRRRSRSRRCGRRTPPGGPPTRSMRGRLAAWSPGRAARCWSGARPPAGPARGTRCPPQPALRSASSMCGRKFSSPARSETNDRSVAGRIIRSNEPCSSHSRRIASRSVQPWLTAVARKAAFSPPALVPVSTSALRTTPSSAHTAAYGLSAACVERGPRPPAGRR